ncbi:hypothetical protein [Ehrlichia muris]|uniref:hypothetical protein n=1 Tax=Ehrlichia muris TaxID=35795 RepID=UPI0037BF1DE1
MHLILLSYVDSQLSLLPEKYIRYNKELNRCYTGDTDTDVLLNPVGISNFSQRLYRSRFYDYSIVSNPKLGDNLVFLYGNNPSGKSVYVALLQPNGLMPNLFQEGVILNEKNLISAGVLDATLSNLSSEEKTIRLFPSVVDMLEITAETPRSCLTQFSYFNSCGEIYNTSYKSIVLDSVDVDQLGDQIFHMKLQ